MHLTARTILFGRANQRAVGQIGIVRSALDSFLPALGITLGMEYSENNHGSKDSANSASTKIYDTPDIGFFQSLRTASKSAAPRKGRPLELGLGLYFRSN